MDDALKGFGVKITPAGRKIYIVRHRTGACGAPTKRLTLDIHGRITADQAREAAVLALAERLRGKDTIETKKQSRKKSENTFDAVFSIFKAKHLSTLRSGDEVASMSWKDIDTDKAVWSLSREGVGRASGMAT